MNPTASPTEYGDTLPCYFWRLPPELRREIYSYAFTYTVFTWRGWWKRNLLVPNRLALLRTCKRVSEDVGYSWISLILFDFSHPKTMMDRFSGLSEEKLRFIRHVRLKGALVPGEQEDAPVGKYRYQGIRTNLWGILPDYMARHPGFQLDTLTVVDYSFGHKVTSKSIASLLQHFRGFKELRVWRQNYLLTLKMPEKSALLGHNDVETPSDDYVKALEQEDGSSKAPFVKLYQSNMKWEFITDSRQHRVWEDEFSKEAGSMGFKTRTEKFLTVLNFVSYK